MALKGTTKIELTNVHTGQKEVVEHHNMITNVLSAMNKRMYGVNGMDTFLYMYAKQFLGANDPFWKAMFSGIILFEDALSESADEYIFPAGNNVVGCGDIERVKTLDMTDTTCSVLGNFNSDESVFKDNMVKMVYDFPTSQGNGTISSIALCNKSLARSCYVYGSNKNHIVLANITNTVTKNTVVSSISNDGNVYTIKFYYYETENMKIKLSSKVASNKLLMDELKTISVELDASDYSFNFALNDKNIIVLYSDPIGKFKYVSLADGNVYEKTKPSGYDTVYPYDGYFMAVKYTDSKYHYSILKDDGTVLHEIVDPNNFSFNCGMLDNRYIVGYIGVMWILLFDVISGGYKYFYVNEQNVNSYTRSDVFDNIIHFTYWDPWNKFYSFSTWQPWLTTKNNLDSPVTKTSDKTMKVTYTLTEA